MRRALIFISLLLFFICCNRNSKVEKINRAFYYWKSSDYHDINNEKLKEISVKKIYVKFFEVDYSEATGNFPYDKLSEYNSIFHNSDSISIIPTIFIKNEIFKFNNEKDLDLLADNIVFLVSKRCKNIGDNIIVQNEIQIDCDWTKSTKEKYFYLLKKIKEISKKEISCTLRLYPYKYSDIMGVPPVDRATLMCYNLIKPLSENNKNSILDNEELRKYLNQKINYPIHLDIVLPVYSWSQLYQNNHFSKLVSISSTELDNFCKKTKPMWYEVTKDTSIRWEYYRVGDLVKCEEVSKNDIDEAIKIIKNKVNLDKEITIAFFDLNESVFNKYDDKTFNSWYNSFYQ